VPVTDIAAVLYAGGFRESATAWIVAESKRRDAYAARIAAHLVWEVGDDDVRAVGVTADGRYCQVDFSALGERYVGCWGLSLPGIPTHVSDFHRLFGRGGCESHHASPEGAKRLRAALTECRGEPRAPRILTIDE
jgi:hypothetical protein